MDNKAELEALDGVLGEIANLVRRLRKQGEINANVATIAKLRLVRGQLITLVDSKVKT